MIGTYIKETATSWSATTIELAGAVSAEYFQTFVEALQAEQPASPNTSWSDVGYCAYTLDADGDYSEVEVGRGTITAAAAASPAVDTLTRSDANVDFSTNSNNVVDFAGGSTVYVVCTLNAYQLINGV